MLRTFYKDGGGNGVAFDSEKQSETGLPAVLLPRADVTRAPGRSEGTEPRPAVHPFVGAPKTDSKDTGQHVLVLGPAPGRHCAKCVP